MTTNFMDPTSELSPANRQVLQRPKSIVGLTLGLLNISKPRGDVFLDRLEELFGKEGVEIKRYKKPTFTRVAPVELCQQIANECDLVVESLAD